MVRGGRFVGRWSEIRRWKVLTKEGLDESAAETNAARERD